MLSLMLADDEQYERQYLEKIIKESYPTLLRITCKAENGMQLIEEVTRCTPQIILLDIKMPQIDGLEAARHIKKNYPDVQIIIVSAYSDFNYAKKAMELGISEYLLKPYSDADLRGVLDRVIAGIREKKDTLSMLFYSEQKEPSSIIDIFEYLEKKYIWNIFFKKTTIAEVKAKFELRGINEGWLKVILISSSALSSMGDFSQEVLKNYFQMEGVTVLNSIWMSQMTICLFAKQKDAFTELNSCIRRARKYLVEKHQIPVACGVSGAYYGLEELSNAYEEASTFITEFAQPEEKSQFIETTSHLKRLCELEEDIIALLIESNENGCIKKWLELVEMLERDLAYQDIAVKLNFARSLFSVIYGINERRGVRIKTNEAIAQLGKLEQLNFNGDNLKYHMDFFAGMKVTKD